MTGLGVWLFTIYLFIAPLLWKTLFFSLSSQCTPVPASYAYVTFLMDWSVNDGYWSGPDRWSTWPLRWYCYGPQFQGLSFLCTKDFDFRSQFEMPHAYCILPMNLKLYWQITWCRPCLGCEVLGFLLVPGICLPVHLATLSHLDP